MSIHFKGILKEEKDLKLVNISKYHEMKTERVDTMRIYSVLAIPALFCLILLRSDYTGTLSTLLICDGIAIFVAIGIMLLREYLRGMTFAKEETIEIWLYRFSMFTHCTQQMSAKEMLRTFLFPQLCITVPICIILIAMVIMGVSGLFAKVIGFFGLIMIFAAYDDLCNASWIHRNQNKIKKMCRNGLKYYYR